MDLNQDVTFDVKDVIERTGLDLEDYLEIYELFQENFNELMGDLKQALADQETEKLMHTAHTLKGSTSNIGFAHIADLAKKIQDDPGDFEQAANLIPQMEELYVVLDKQVQAVAATVS